MIAFFLEQSLKIVERFGLTERLAARKSDALYKRVFCNFSEYFVHVGKPTAVKGLKKKDGSTFDAKLVLGPKPYSGWAELAPREAKPKKPTARKGASSKPFGRRGR